MATEHQSLYAGPTADPDKYELHELKSRGGEGEVWKGTIIVDSVHVQVAVKVILGSNASDLKEWHRRWIRQAELLKSLSHPGLMTVREVFVGPKPHVHDEADHGDETLYLVANWVEGPTLPEWVARNPDRDALESLRIIGNLAAAVDYLHSGSGIGQPLLHRDIKPSNVIVSDKGAVLVDFGFVRAQGTDQPMTMVGSPSYIAPEVASGLGYTEASDRFALGATAYFALTGEPPHVDDPVGMRQRLDAVRGFEHRPDLHEHLLSMLSMDPKARPVSAIEWAQGLAAMSVVGGATVISTRSEPATPPREVRLEEFSPRRGVSKVAVGVVAVVVVAAAAAGIGWALVGNKTSPSGPEATSAGSTSTSSAEGQAATSSTETQAGATTAPVASSMPAVVGLTEGDARASLLDAGITNEITVEERPDKGEVGIVLDQVPATGDSVSGQTTVTLVVSSEYLVEAPSLVGETQGDAEAELMALGFASIDVNERPSAKAEGTVLGQSPGAGAEVGLDRTFTITVASVAQTPDLSELTTAEATAAVEALDGTLTIEQVYNPDAETGAYVGQTPAPGEPMTEHVVLQVAQGPSTLLLEDMTPLALTSTDRPFDDMRPYFGQGDIDGVRYIHALIFRQTDSGLESGTAEYNLSRKFDRFRATVGYSDNAGSDGKVRLEVYGDGNLLFSNDYTLGSSEDVSVDITGVLRLKIIGTTLCCSTYSEDEALILGQAELLAPADVIAEYQQ
jgi:hypothetical protein